MHTVYGAGSATPVPTPVPTPMPTPEPTPEPTPIFFPSKCCSLLESWQRANLEQTASAGFGLLVLGADSRSLCACAFVQRPCPLHHPVVASQTAPRPGQGALQAVPTPTACHPAPPADSTTTARRRVVAISTAARLSPLDHGRLALAQHSAHNSACSVAELASARLEALGLLCEC